MGVGKAVVSIGRCGSASFGGGAPSSAKSEMGVDGAFGGKPGADFWVVGAEDM